jgi:hypothetical protein
VRPYLKNNEKRTVQVVECLSSKLEALSSTTTHPVPPPPHTHTKRLNSIRKAGRKEEKEEA